MMKWIITKICWQWFDSIYCLIRLCWILQLTIACWHTCFPFHTSPIRHCGTYHNRHKPYWNWTQTVSPRKRPASVLRAFLFQAVSSFPLRKLGRCSDFIPLYKRNKVSEILEFCNLFQIGNINSTHLISGIEFSRQMCYNIWGWTDGKIRILQDV